MDFAEWDVYYRQILEDFGYAREADERAAKVLDARLGGERIDPEALRPLFAGRDVTIAGNAPSLERELVAVEHPLVAADEATSVLRKAGIRPDVIVTDLDGDLAAIEAWAPKFRGRVIGTTQAGPFGRIHNFGGFTDGDRAAFLADHLGARSLLLLGFDFETPSPKDADPETKKRKLDC